MAALGALDAVLRPSRLLAVIDVSGSMNSAVPAATGPTGPTGPTGSSSRIGGTRIDVARAAAGAGVGLLPDGSVAGLWEFATDLTPTTDYRELVPLAPLNPVTRQLLATAADGLAAVPHGGTGLYDTVLAAVHAVQADYDPDAVNSVVVLTDGRDEDDPAHGLALGILLGALQAERASDRPVEVITIAYGPDSDAATLRRISAASGGAEYDSSDPRDLPTIFRAAIGHRLCGTAC